MMRISTTIFVLAMFVLPSAAMAQADIERTRTVHADICPAPELVNAHMVLDPNAQSETFSGPFINSAAIAGSLGGSSPSVTVIPDEPQDSDEVLSEFRQDYGLDIPATEFLRATITLQGGAAMCHYRSDVVDPAISIRTISNSCRAVRGPWEGEIGGIQICEGSRRQCMYRCTE